MRFQDYWWGRVYNSLIALKKKEKRAYSLFFRLASFFLENRLASCYNIASPQGQPVVDFFLQYAQACVSYIDRRKGEETHPQFEYNAKRQKHTTLIPGIRTTPTTNENERTCLALSLAKNAKKTGHRANRPRHYRCKQHPSHTNDHRTNQINVPPTTQCLEESAGRWQDLAGHEEEDAQQWHTQRPRGTLPEGQPTPKARRSKLQLLGLREQPRRRLHEGNDVVTPLPPVSEGRNKGFPQRSRRDMIRTMVAPQEGNDTHRHHRCQHR